MGYLKDERPQTMGVDGEWQVGAYHWKANLILDEFVQGFKEKKIIGGLCTGCGRTIVPPRMICGRCHQRITERRVVSQIGTITCFIISPPVEKGKYRLFGLDPVETGALKEGEVLIPVFVRFDGADSNYATLLLNADPEKVHIGMRVKAVWVENPQGRLDDLIGVEPIEK